MKKAARNVNPLPDRKCAISRTNAIALNHPSKTPSVSKRGLQVQRICEECGSRFTAKTSTTRFCSAPCNQKSYYHRHKEKIIDCKVKRKSAHNPKRSTTQTTDYTPSSDKDLLTVKEFADKLGICKQSAYNMSLRGQVRIIRFTGRISYISWSEFMSMIQCSRPLQLSTTTPLAAPNRVMKKNSTLSSEPVGLPIPNVESAAATQSNPLWIDTETACKRYNLIRPSFYSFVYYHKIPRQTTKNGTVLYSVEVMDDTRGLSHRVEGYITLCEASAKFGISYSAICRKVNNNPIIKVKSNGKVMFAEKDLAGVLKRCTGA